jgi:hypothetical protein
MAKERMKLREAIALYPGLLDEEVTWGYLASDSPVPSMRDATKVAFEFAGEYGRSSEIFRQIKTPVTDLPMIRDSRRIFADAMETAIRMAKQTGKRYFVFFPSIANPGHQREDVFLIVPLVREDSLEPGDNRDEIAFTICPNGEIRYHQKAS